MALPTLVKTWQIEGSQAVGGDNLSMHQGIIFTLKQNMIGKDFSGSSLGYTNPWVVESSCDGTGGGGSFGNNDLVDRWIDSGDLVWANTGTSHSWVVLKNNVTGVQVCFDLDSSNDQFMHLSWSLAAGYGVANGGTDGSASDRPTATDQRTLINTAAFCGGSASETNAVVHTWQSTDGECTRVAAMFDEILMMFWAFDKAQNPVAGWNGNYVVAQSATGTTIPTGTFFLLAGTSNTFGRDGATDFDMFMATEMFGIATEPYLGSVIRYDDVDGYVDFTSITLVGEAPRRGEHGECYDLWFGNNFRHSGHTWPNDLTRTFIQMGDLVLPWDGAAVRVIG